jgi:hypothetical protein
VIGMKTQTQAYYIFRPICQLVTRDAAVLLIDCLILSRRKDDSSKLNYLHNDTA